MDFLAFAACSEFPNDNPALHGGAIWVGATLGEPLCETRRPLEPPPQQEVDRCHDNDRPLIEAAVGDGETTTDPTPPVMEADDEHDDIEIVDEIAIEDPIDESPAPVEATATVAEDFVADPPPHPGVALERQTVVAETETPASEQPSPGIDAFALFVQAVEGVARAAGATEASMTALAVLLGRARLDASATDAERTLRGQALAWQGILRGESEDFTACGNGMLDEWAASLVAHVLQMSGRADGFKRELRCRGVAAFGLVDQAA